MTDDPSKRPPIPSAIKRGVRQKCHFGCVICGIPIFDYDHVEEWSKTKVHEADNLILLCDAHHRAKTNGRLNLDYLQKKIANPANKSRAMTAKEEVGVIFGSEFKAVIGSNYFTQTVSDGARVPMIVVDDEVAVGCSVEDGRILLHLRLYDEAGDLALFVEAGEIQVSTGVWDYKFEGRRVTISSGLRKIVVALSIYPDGVLIERSVIFGPQGSSVRVTRKSLDCSVRDGPKLIPKRNRFRDCCIRVGPVGIGILHATQVPWTLADR